MNKSSQTSEVIHSHDKTLERYNRVFTLLPKFPSLSFTTFAMLWILLGKLDSNIYRGCQNNVYTF